MDKNIVITGILCLYSKYKFPANKRNIPRYRFNPLSKKYPIFLVASKLKNKYKTNILVTIKFLSQEIKIPYGEIVNVIGSIDDINNLYDGILYNNNLIQKKLNINKKQVSLKKDPFDNKKSKLLR